VKSRIRAGLRGWDEEVQHNGTRARPKVKSRVKAGHGGTNLNHSASKVRA
jgi:hypothetical protein